MLVACALVTVTLGAVVFAADGPLSVDRHALALTVAHRSGLVSAARTVSLLGDPAVLVGLAVLAAVWLWRTRVAALPAAVPLIALLAASATGTVAKQLVARARPPAVFHLAHESNYSFPSGHATGAAALLVAFALVLAPTLDSSRARTAAVVGLTLLAAMVGVARLILGVHWVTDIVEGFALGSGMAILAVVLVAT